MCQGENFNQNNKPILFVMLEWILGKSNMIMHFREGNNLTPPIMNDTSYQTAFVALTNIYIVFQITGPGYPLVGIIYIKTFVLVGPNNIHVKIF